MPVSIAKCPVLRISLATVQAQGQCSAIISLRSDAAQLYTLSLHIRHTATGCRYRCKKQNTDTYSQIQIDTVRYSYIQVPTIAHIQLDTDRHLDVWPKQQQQQ